jgi:hypothetical protein
VVGDGVLYASQALDITPQVLAALQARAKNASASAPSTKSTPKQ